MVLDWLTVSLLSDCGECLGSPRWELDPSEVRDSCDDYQHDYVVAIHGKPFNARW